MRGAGTWCGLGHLPASTSEEPAAALIPRPRCVQPLDSHHLSGHLWRSHERLSRHDYVTNATSVSSLLPDTAVRVGHIPARSAGALGCRDSEVARESAIGPGSTAPTAGIGSHSRPNQEPAPGRRTFPLASRLVHPGSAWCSAHCLGLGRSGSGSTGARHGR
jgi:hypothetical protein